MVNPSTIRRLVGGLASEKVRWAESIEMFKQEEKTLAGDVLLTSSYLSYVGCFGRNYRTDLLEAKWMEFLKTLQVIILHSFSIRLYCSNSLCVFAWYICMYVGMSQACVQTECAFI